MPRRDRLGAPLIALRRIQRADNASGDAKLPKKPVAQAKRGGLTTCVFFYFISYIVIKMDSHLVALLEFFSRPSEES